MRKENNIPLYAALSVFVVAAITVFVIFAAQKPDVAAEEDPKFEIYSEVMLSDLIAENKKEKMVTRDKRLTLDSLGEKTVSVTMKNDLGISYETELKYTCVDTTPPEIILTQEKVLTDFGKTIDLRSFIKSVNDNFDENVSVETNDTVNTEKAGEYKICFTAKDSSGNESKKILTVTVEQNKFNIDENGDFSLVDGTYKTSNGHTLVIKKGVAKVDDIVIVNKSFPISLDYAKEFDPVAKAAYDKMAASAKKDGIKLSIDNSYRTNNTQKSLYDRYTEKYGKDKADTFSARPGHSEHQSGTAIDLIYTDTDGLTKYAAEFKWLNDNAYKFGYVLRYPQGKEEITGYIYEAWHYRYVGTELAKTLYNKGNWITLEEYFGIDSEYKY